METEHIYAALPGALLPWYEKNARDLPWRHTKDPYRVLVSEIMLQQTRVEAVRGYYARFLESFPTVEALANAEESRVLKLWEGLGYYSRARNLQKAAREIVFARSGSFPESAAALEKLPGVGPYTAGAVASICFGEAAPAVDGNVLRILARMTAEPRAVDLPAVKGEMADRLRAVYPKGRCGDFTQSLMELGACVCTPKGPDCPGCPAAAFCRARAENAAETYPVRLPKREKRVEKRTVFLLSCGDRFAIRKRGETGLLAGLWEFPNVAATLSPQEAVRWAEEAGAAPRDLLRSAEREHVFTHIRWEMTAYRIVCRAAPGPFRWATADELETVCALPTAFRQFLPYLF